MKLAVGMDIAEDIKFSNWERIMSNIIIDNNLGADRIDYLLRDSHHIGVAYGKFDHFRLIDCIRILESGEVGDSDQGMAPELGIEFGGIHAVEALGIARYYMYKQVYLHAIRRIYDIHLADFLVEWLPNNRFTGDTEELLNLTDNEVNSALYCSQNIGNASSVHAQRIVERNHFKVVYAPPWNATQIGAGGVKSVYQELSTEFEGSLLRMDHFVENSQMRDIPVLVNDDRTVSSISLSELLEIPLVAAISRIYADGSIYEQVMSWLNNQGYRQKPTARIGG